MARNPMLRKPKQKTPEEIEQDILMQELSDKASWSRSTAEDEAVAQWDSINKPPMHSGATTGGVSMAKQDFRTDQYLEVAARRGELDNFKDTRSREYAELYGPRGVLGGNNIALVGGEFYDDLREIYARQGIQGAILAYREFKQKNKKKSGGSGLSFQGPMSIGQANATVRRMTGG
jgi:hypothetical protein